MIVSTFTGMVRASGQFVCVYVCIVSHKRLCHKVTVSNSQGTCIGFGKMQRYEIHSVAKNFWKLVETNLPEEHVQAESARRLWIGTQHDPGIVLLQTNLALKVAPALIREHSK